MFLRRLIGLQRPRLARDSTSTFIEVNSSATPDLQTQVILARYQALDSRLETYIRQPFQVVRDAALVSGALVGAVSLFEISPETALSFAIIYAIAVPGVLLIMTMSWSADVFSRELFEHEIELLKFQFPQVEWPASARELRTRRLQNTPRNRYGIVAGALALPGAALGSIGLAAVELALLQGYDFDRATWIVLGAGGLTWIAIAGTVVVLYFSLRSSQRGRYSLADAAARVEWSDKTT